jgi:hypothetical protein
LVFLLPWTSWLLLVAAEVLKVVVVRVATEQALELLAAAQALNLP